MIQTETSFHPKSLSLQMKKMKNERIILHLKVTVTGHGADSTHTGNGNLQPTVTPGGIPFSLHS